MADKATLDAARKLGTELMTLAAKGTAPWLGGQALIQRADLDALEKQDLADIQYLLDTKHPVLEPDYTVVKAEAWADVQNALVVDAIAPLKPEP